MVGTLLGIEVVGTLLGIEMAAFADADGLMRSKRHIRAPSVSRMPCMINLPAEL